MAGDEASTIAEIIEECGGKRVDKRKIVELWNSETLVPLKTVNLKEKCQDTLLLMSSEDIAIFYLLCQ